MSTLVPNAISILTAYLKRAGFKNIDLFDTTFYESAGVTRAQADGKSKYDVRVKYGNVQPFNFEERNVKLKQTDMFNDFVNKVNNFNPDIIFASLVEDTYPIFIKFMELIKNILIMI